MPSAASLSSARDAGGASGASGASSLSGESRTSGESMESGSVELSGVESSLTAGGSDTGDACGASVLCSSNALFGALGGAMSPDMGGGLSFNDLEAGLEFSDRPGELLWVCR